jgi:hypothetical protein
MRRAWLRRPPRALRKAKLDNAALVPASLLPHREQYQEIANGLPGGNVLVVIPDAPRASRAILEQVASSMRERGKPVTILASTSIEEPAQ